MALPVMQFDVHSEAQSLPIAALVAALFTTKMKTTKRTTA